MVSSCVDLSNSNQGVHADASPFVRPLAFPNVLFRPV